MLASEATYTLDLSRSFRGRMKSHFVWRGLVKFTAPIFSFVWENFLHPRRRLAAAEYFRNHPYVGTEELLRKLGVREAAAPELEAFAKWLRGQIPEELMAQRRKEMQKDPSEEAFSVCLEGGLSREVKIRILEFCLSPAILGPVLRYFRLVPRLDSILVMFNVPKAGQEQSGSKEWHRDNGIYKGLNFFQCISSVDDSSGAYYAVEADSIPRHANVPLERVDLRRSVWARFRHSTQLIEKYAPGFRRFRLAGPAGTGAFVDPGLCYHRGGHCTSGERLMIQVSFTLDTPYAQAGVLKLLGLEGDPWVEAKRADPFYRLLLDGNEASIFWKLGMQNPVFSLARKVLSYNLPLAAK